MGVTKKVKYKNGVETDEKLDLSNAAIDALTEILMALDDEGGEKDATTGTGTEAA